MKVREICRERFYWLLRFGRKNDSGGWATCDDHDHCTIPDDGDADELLLLARLGEVVMEYKKTTGHWPGNNDLWWGKFEYAALND
ncbi:MAG: hypothetical protein HGA96_09685 [Desulfobulbaceae bacterium]|nr:hypothetical protein [Desulfobulbaceae bacterium]